MEAPAVFMLCFLREEEYIVPDLGAVVEVDKGEKCCGDSGEVGSGGQGE